MKWNEVNHEHHGLVVEVSDPRPPRSSSVRELLIGKERILGRIKCEKNCVPVLVTDGGKKVHTFAGWYNVEVIE